MMSPFLKNGILLAVYALGEWGDCKNERDDDGGEMIIRAKRSSGYRKRNGVHQEAVEELRDAVAHSEIGREVGVERFMRDIKAGASGDVEALRRMEEAGAISRELARQVLKDEGITRLPVREVGRSEDGEHRVFRGANREEIVVHEHEPKEEGQEKGAALEAARRRAQIREKAYVDQAKAAGLEEARRNARRRGKPWGDHEEAVALEAARSKARMGGARGILGDDAGAATARREARARGNAAMDEEVAAMEAARYEALRRGRAALGDERIAAEAAERDVEMRRRALDEEAARGEAMMRANGGMNKEAEVLEDAHEEAMIRQRSLEEEEDAALEAAQRRGKALDEEEAGALMEAARRDALLREKARDEEDAALHAAHRAAMIRNKGKEDFKKAIERCEKSGGTNCEPEVKKVLGMKEFSKAFLAEDHEEELADLNNSARKGIPGAAERYKILQRKLELANQILQGVFPRHESFEEVFGMPHRIERRRMMQRIDDPRVDPVLKEAIGKQIKKPESLKPKEIEERKRNMAAGFAKAAYEKTLNEKVDEVGPDYAEKLANINGKIAHAYASTVLDEMTGEEKHPEHAHEKATKLAEEYRKGLLGEPYKEQEDEYTDLGNFKEKAQKAKYEEKLKEAALREADARRHRDIAKEHPGFPNHIEPIKSEFHKAEEDRAAYQDYEAIKKAGEIAKKMILEEGGTQEEALIAERNAKNEMLKTLQKRRKQKMIEVKDALLHQNINPQDTQRIADHLASASTVIGLDDGLPEKKAEIIDIVSDKADTVELQNSVIDLPLSTIPRITPSTEKEAETLVKLSEMRSKLRNTFTKQKLPTGLSIVQTEKGFYNIPESAKDLIVDQGKIYYSQSAYDTMVDQNKNVSGLVPKIVEFDNGPLGNGATYYEADISNMRMQLPTPLQPFGGKSLTNSTETLDISLASKIDVAKGRITMVPMEKFIAKIRPRTNLVENVTNDEKVEAAEKAFEKQEMTDSSRVSIIKTPNGFTAVSVTPSYGHSKVMAFGEAIQKFSADHVPTNLDSEPIYPLDMEEVRLATKKAMKSYLTKNFSSFSQNIGKYIVSSNLSGIILRNPQETARRLGMSVKEFISSVSSIPAKTLNEIEGFYLSLARSPDTMAEKMITIGKQSFFVELSQRFPNVDMKNLIQVIFEAIRIKTGEPNVAFDKLVMKIPVAAIPVTNPAKGALPPPPVPQVVTNLTPRAINSVINRRSVIISHFHPNIPVNASGKGSPFYQYMAAAGGNPRPYNVIQYQGTMGSH